MIPIMQYGCIPSSEIFSRKNIQADVAAVVTEIIQNVRNRGDEALLEYSLKFDKARLDSLAVTQAEIDEAFASVAPRFLSVLEKAAENIRAYHQKQARVGFESQSPDGIVTGQKILPIAQVGVYVPGGTASYPSTVLMDTIPAVIAGCKRIVMVTPPNPQGKIAPVILAAAKIAGVHEIYKVGGAQAVAALAYGTESIAKVDKIVGPGNAFVAEAKKQVFGQVSIDMIAGPSEILVIADSKSNPSHVAADMLSQAEHDRMASAVLVTDSMDLAQAVSAELERQIPLLPRAEIARASIDNHGKIIVAEDLQAVLAVANEIAPEHLELMVDEPFAYLEKIENAGSVFLGHNCPEALGDYYAGPNHTLPTSGTARFSSALNVDDFVKRSQYIYCTQEVLGNIGADVAYFAQQEGLDAHARSILIRTEE